LFPLHVLTFGCKFAVVHPCVIVCDSPLQETLFFFTISLQNLHAHLDVCPFVRICKLLWQVPCTNFVIRDVLVVNGICISTADVRLVGYISDSNPSVLLNQDVYSFSHCPVFVKRSDGPSGLHQRRCSATSETFHPLVHLPLHNTVFPVLCQYFSMNLEDFCPPSTTKSNDSTLLKNGTIRKRSRHVYTVIARASLDMTATARHA